MQILEVKYSAERIGDIDLLQLDKKVKVAMLRIHVITGWTIPIQEMMDVFIYEFRTLLLQEYADLNFEEILFGFRKYKHIVEDWGKEMNLKIIGTILDAYGEDRYDAGLLEERLKMEFDKPLLEFKPKEYTDDEIVGIALDYWQHSLAPKIEFINPNCYEILNKQGKIILDEPNKERIKKYATLLMEGYFTNVIEFKKMKQDKNYISMLCKKIAVSEYFNLLKDEN